MYNNGLADSINTDANWAYKSITVYNKSGNTQSSTSLNGSGKASSMLYTYNADGRKATITGGDGHNISTSTYTTNNDGELVEQSSYDNLKTGTRIVYNKAGHRDTTYAYSIRGELSFKMVYHYNQHNQLTETVSYKADGNINYTESFEYDKQNNQLKRTRYKASGEPQSWMSFTYDEHHEILTERDSADMFIGPPGYMKDKQNPQIMYRQFRYSNYDLHGNWQRKDVMYYGKSVQTTLRTVEYY